MKIRNGGPEDIPEILSLLDGAVEWLAAHVYKRQTPARVEHIGKYGQGPFLIRLAVDGEGRAVGSCVLSEERPEYATAVDGPELYIRNLVTDRTRKGSGIGAALIADALDEARRRGIGLLRVDCFAGGDRKLVGQYRALGFTETESFEVEQPAGLWQGQILAIRL